MKLLQLVPGTLCNDKLWAALGSALAQQISIAHVPIEKATDATGILHSISAATSQSGHLCGFSMGGYYALTHAIENPKLESLVVMGSHCTMLMPREMAQRRKAIEFLSDMRNRNTPMPQKRLEDFISPQSPDFKSVTQVIREMETDLGSDVLKNQLLTSLERPDLTEQLSDIQCPVLVIAGENDRLMKPQALEAMAGAIPRGQFALLPGISHMLPLEAPAKVAELILKFHAELKPKSEEGC